MKKVIIVIVIIIILGAAIGVAYMLNNKENIDENVINNVSTNNTIENNIEENIITNNVSANEIINTQTEISNVSEQDAINIIKSDWGMDDTVYFTVESKNAEGEYRISVTDKFTTGILAWYTVNSETGEFRDGK